MKKFSIITFLAIAIFSVQVFAQGGKGKVSGKLIDKANGEDLIGAVVQVEGQNIGTATDIEGQFLLSLEPGFYTLLLNYVSYKTEKIQGVEVKAGQVTYLNFAMQEESTQLEEVVITYTVEKSSTDALLIERKNAAQVSDGVSADIIRKTPDRSTADVLKRVTGASIQDGKFAIIRGMNDRYNAGYLDGALLPSTEADRKAFAFDVVPASLLDNLQIIKAGSPDLLGDFGGGVIKINTKSVPEKFTQNISIGGQYNAITTGQNFKQYDKYSGENLNIISKERDLPSFGDSELKSKNAFPTPAEISKFVPQTQKFNHNWDINDNKAPLNPRIAYSVGMPIKLTETRKIGLIFAYNYGLTRRYSASTINNYNDVGLASDFSDKIYTQNVSNGGLLNLNYNSKKIQFGIKNLYNNNSDNRSIFREGISNVSDNLLSKSSSNLINYNRLFNSAANVKAVIGNNFIVINGGANFSTIRRRQPDYKIVNYSKTTDNDFYLIQFGDQFNSSSGRFNSDLKEKLYGGNLDASINLTKGVIKTDVKVGGLIQLRNRDFYGRSFVYGGNASSTFNPALDLSSSAVSTSGIYLTEKTDNAFGYYQGKSKLWSGFAMIDNKLFEKLRLVYGVRYENIKIDVTNDKLTKSKISEIDNKVWLPSANLSYSLSEKSNLRMAYYHTVNRPEFRELAPFSFYVFDLNAEIVGNKDLKVANLKNYELRYEFFPSSNQLISIGGFYKTIENPIEFSIDVAQSQITTFRYGNQQKAKVYGVELEFRKSFDFIGKSFAPKVFNNIVVYSNLALIKSQLNFEEGTSAAQNRQLQGQSPYVLNAGLQYENEENGWSASLVVNRVGRRIAYVGVDKKFGITRQDIYENPRTVVDFQIGKTIKKFNMKATFGDLLHQDLVFYQDGNKNGKFDKNDPEDLKMFSYTFGMSITGSIAYNF